MSEKRINKITRDKLIKLFESIGYKVTNQSTNGTYKLLRYPDGASTEYWLFPDRIEHQLGHSMGGAYFSYKDCYALCEGGDTVAVIVKNIEHNGIFVQFHNFGYQPTPTPQKRRKNE